MAFPILPPKYYLTHFFEFLEFLEEHYLPVMEESHRKFISDFRSLSENAQCVYVRMINRKGSVFHRDVFQKYSEIEDTLESLEELEMEKFIGSLTANSRKDLLDYLTKSDLRKWFSKNSIESKVSASREQLKELGRERIDELDISKVHDANDLVVQQRTQEMDYLLFLYFGSIQKSLNLYTLRDLGIRKSNTLKTKFRARFSTLEEAQADYYFAQQIDRLDEIQTADQVREIIETSRQYQKLRSSTQNLKDELLLRLGEACLETDPDLAILSFQESQHPEARERAVRHLYKRDEKSEARFLLEQIIENPRSDTELLFAEDFLSRKFDKKKLGFLTESLRNSQEIVLSDFYLKKPEQGVREYYKRLGFTAQFTENFLWLSLFGILFWDELFESEESGIHNPFERSPADLVGKDFYIKHRNQLETKMALLKDSKAISKYLLQTITKNYGRLNDVFQWHPTLTQSLLDFTKHSQQQDVALILRTMVQKFEYYHSGFPDLMVEKDGVIRFIEVKAEGDALRANQLSKIRLIREAGFEVEVLRVRWETDPNQVYVVVDVETTGGSAGFHRVTEIGAVKIQNGHVIEEFQTLINPERSIPAYITQITGITNQMVADAPTFGEIAERFLAFMDGAIFVAHNVRFDYGFIQREFSRAGIDFIRPQLCTCSGMRKAFPGIQSYSLKNLTEHFHISLDSHHRALCDAKAAAELFLLMAGKRQNSPGAPLPEDQNFATID